jgi:hypothetical protein
MGRPTTISYKAPRNGMAIMKEVKANIVKSDGSIYETNIANSVRPAHEADWHYIVQWTPKTDYIPGEYVLQVVGMADAPKMGKEDERESMPIVEKRAILLIHC